MLQLSIKQSSAGNKLYTTNQGREKQTSQQSEIRLLQRNENNKKRF
jgi:hypothetical protein